MSFRTFMTFNCKASWLKAFDTMSYKMTAGMKCGSDSGADSEQVPPCPTVKGQNTFLEMFTDEFCKTKTCECILTSLCRNNYSTEVCQVLKQFFRKWSQWESRLTKMTCNLFFDMHEMKAWGQVLKQQGVEASQPCAICTSFTPTASLPALKPGL